MLFPSPLHGIGALPNLSCPQKPPHRAIKPLAACAKFTAPSLLASPLLLSCLVLAPPCAVQFSRCLPQGSPSLCPPCHCFKCECCLRCTLIVDTDSDVHFCVSLSWDIWEMLLHGSLFITDLRVSVTSPSNHLFSQLPSSLGKQNGLGVESTDHWSHFGSTISNL